MAMSDNGAEDVPSAVEAHVRYFNEGPPEFSLGYLTPKQFLEKFPGIGGSGRETEGEGKETEDKAKVDTQDE